MSKLHVPDNSQLNVVDGGEYTSSSCFPALSRVWRRASLTSRRATSVPEKSSDRIIAPVTSSEVHGDTTRTHNCTCYYSPPKEGEKLWLHDELPEYHPGNFCDEFYKPELMATVEEKLGSINTELRELSLNIHDHPEVGFKEKHAHDTLTAFMASHGFNVTPHYKGLETAWKAEAQVLKGGRTLGINSEMDALPGIGHACGHNLIAISGVGVAIAVKAALEKHQIPGKVVLLGTPAEEGGGGKVVLLERGGYKGMDVCLMCHPGPGPSNSVGLGSSLAVRALEVEYFGHTAHASAYPWEGQNALDAAVLAYQSISVLRQQIKPDHRVHGIIEGKNWAPNVIPDYSKLRYIVRAPTYAEVIVLRKRVEACFRAAAEATSCRMTSSAALPYYDLRQNSVLAQEFYRTVSEKFGSTLNHEEGAIGGSTDFGNVTYEVPGLHPMFTIPTQPGGGNHTVLFAQSARTLEAHEVTMNITKGLALLGLRVIDDDDFYARVKKEYEESVVPPPDDLN